MTTKTVQDSAISGQVKKIFPSDMNSHHTVFGGMIMAEIDRLALVVAERHAGKVCVTASVDAVHFMAPAKADDTLVYCLAVNRSWTTSMEIGAKVMAENSYTGERKHIVSAYLTFIAVDENHRPTPVPKLKAAPGIEEQRYKEAQWRREQRLRHAKELKTMRSDGK